MGKNNIVKRIFSIVLSIMLLTLAMPIVVLAGNAVTKPLIAGKNTQIGTVTVSDDGANLTVSYNITESGWYLTKTHIYVGLQAPQSSAPGLFPYAHSGLHTISDTYTNIPIEVDKKYYVAAHADVLNENNIIGYDCPALDEIAASLPSSGTIQAINYPNNNSYFDISFTNSGNLNGIHPTWCIDETHYIYIGSYYTANFYSSYGPIPDYLTSGIDPNIDYPDNMDLVNWVVNNTDGYTSGDVQNVIWHLIDSNPATPLTPTQNVLYEAAFANGEGFVPNFVAGDVFTVIVAPVAAAGYQTTIAQVTLSELGFQCTPIYKSDTAWAKGNITWKTGWGSYFTYIP